MPNDSTTAAVAAAKRTPGRIAHNVVTDCGDSDDFDLLPPRSQQAWESAVVAAIASITAHGGWTMQPVRGRETKAVYLSRKGGVALCIEHYGDKRAIAELQVLMAALAGTGDMLASNATPRRRGLGGTSRRCQKPVATAVRFSGHGGNVPR